MKASQKITCPCCKKKKDKSNIQRTIQLFPFDGAFKAVGQTWADSFLQIANSRYNLYQWACDTCIRDGNAILGQPKKQKHTFQSPMDTATPFLAYFDKSYTCQQCHAKFLFSRSEQQYWYEELQFVVYSKPIHCLACRKEKRATKQLNTQLSYLLKDGQPTTIEALEQVAAIYQKIGATEKWKKYLTLAEKLKRRGS